MATFFKYAQREADSYVNWAEIGQGMTDMLRQELELREEKKAALDKQARDLQTILDAAPQGEFQDANDFTNNYADAMKQQNLLDVRMLKSGRMKVKDYILKQQNYLDGTNTLFDLQKLYQEKYTAKMKGVQDGALQSGINGYNMAEVEGFSDFAKSRAVIDPMTGRISVGGLTANKNTGVMELNGNVIPVSVLRGKILSDIKTFDVYGSLNAAKERNGQLVRTMVDAATFTKQGSVTQFVGAKSMEGISQYSGLINEFEKATTDMAEGFFSGSPYNLMSVLTENIKTYDSESFTTDRAVADADPTKILLTIDPATKMNVMDKTGKYYNQQRQEAVDWVKRQWYTMLDNQVKADVGTNITKPTPPVNPYAETTKITEDNSTNFAKMSGLLYGGTQDDIDGAVNYFQSIGVPIERTATGVVGKNADGSTQTFVLSGKDKEKGIRSYIGWLVNNSNIKDKLATEEFLVKEGLKYGGKTLSGFSAVPNITAPPVVVKPAVINYRQEADDILATLPTDVFGYKDTKAVELLKPALRKLGVDVRTGGGTFNRVVVTIPGEKPKTIEASRWGSDGEVSSFGELIDYINSAYKDPKKIQAAFKRSGYTPIQAP